jgi:hypothetical protein
MKIMTESIWQRFLPTKASVALFGVLLGLILLYRQILR